MSLLSSIFGSNKSSSTSTTTQTKRDSTVTVGGNSTGPLITGNENADIKIESLDAEVIKPVLDYSKFAFDKATSSVVEGFSTALEASKSSDERLSGKVFTSVNIGLALAGLGLAVYVFKK